MVDTYRWSTVYKGLFKQSLIGRNAVYGGEHGRGAVAHFCWAEQWLGNLLFVAVGARVPVKTG